ncbi:Hippocampus abundant transcript 1 protein, partial [Mucuna pruriens]
MEGLGGLSHLFVTMFLTGFAAIIALPAITDVTMAALCPGLDQCSLAIYLSGFQQAMVGVGSVVMTPLIGNLSDRYGRKALITLPLTLSVIPHAILAYSRDTEFFYAYYGVKTVAAMAGEGSFQCLALAYVADKVPDGKRTSAFGILAGVGSASFVGATLAARFISTALTFQIASVSSIIALLYMRIFLQDSLPSPTTQPLLKQCAQDDDHHDSSPTPTPTFKKLPSLHDLISLLKCSPTFSQAAIVSFFNSLADGGLMAVLLYYLKARFQFNKNQFADLLMITGIGATLAQLFFMPILVPLIGEERLLSTGLLISCINIFIYSISWAAWVPYALAGCSVFAVFVRPSVSFLLVSVTPSTRIIALKYYSDLSQRGWHSYAALHRSKLDLMNRGKKEETNKLLHPSYAALFLSEEAPFYFPGFSLMCLGLALSLMIRAVPPIAGGKISSSRCTDTLVV